MPEVALILYGGTIHSMDPAVGDVAAIGIAGDTVRAVGELAHVRADLPNAVEVDLDGTTVLPGLIDTHPHLLHFAAIEAPLVDITAATTHGEIVERVAARAAVTERGRWIMTTPVGEPHFFVTRSWRDLAEGRLPDRQVLDHATREHPVMIQAWAPVTPNVIAFNSLALERLGIDASTPARVGNVWVERDARGQPTGIVTGSVTNYYSHDDFAEQLWTKGPYLDLELVLPAAIRAMAQYNSQGVTAVYENHGMEQAFIALYRHLREQDQLTVRVAVAQEAETYTLPGSRPKPPRQFIHDCVQAADSVELEDEMFRFLGMSLMRDGSCWPGNIRMREPYVGPYGQLTTGREYITPNRAHLTMRICAECDMRLNTIVMGTQAHEENLAQLESIARDFDLTGRKWLLVHSWFLESEQARRYARLGMDVTTSMAFVWGKGRLFRERMKASVLGDLVPLRRMLDAGLRVGGGSDWGPKNSFKQIELALTHEVAGSAQPNLGAPQRISREEALSMWTRDAAHVLGWHDIGTLTPGNHADLVIVDRDPMSCDIDEIGATATQATLLGGRLVYGMLPQAAT
jgi:predicted amidohydrolase YtcJ